MYNHLRDALNAYFTAHTSASGRSATDFQTYCNNSSSYSDVFVCDGYRLCRAAKLLMSLGYGNFADVIRYDIYAMAESFIKSGQSWAVGAFQSSKFSLDLSNFEATHIYNSPNLSIFPLLAYHKICNDHYRNEKWQPFEPWTCNIDYLRPEDNMNAHQFISDSPLKTLVTSILDLENSNLPLDYFTSVLPRAQYGDESAVPVGLNNSDATLIVKDSSDPTYRD